MSTESNRIEEPLGIFIEDDGGTESNAVSGDKEPEGRIEEPKSRIETMAGFPTASPFDPNNRTSPGGKRRGRPPGTRNSTSTTAGTDAKTSAAKGPGNLADLEKLLLSLHSMGAVFLAAPGLELEKDEAAKLSAAIKEVGKHYNLTMTPKQAAIVDLAMVSGAIYGPRIIGAIRSNKKKEPAPLVEIRRDTKPGPQAMPPFQAPTKMEPDGRPAPGGPLTPSQIDFSPPADTYSL